MLKIETATDDAYILGKMNVFVLTIARLIEASISLLAGVSFSDHFLRWADPLP